MRPLTLNDRLLVNQYLQRYPPEISELTFTNLYAWRNTRPVWIDIFHDSLIVFTEIEAGLVVLGNPVGPISLTAVLSEYKNLIVGVERYPKARLAEFPISSDVVVIDDRDNSDYVYCREELSTLAGGNFIKKRNRINQCLAAYTCEYEIITPEIIPECLAMQERWCSDRDCRIKPGLDGEYQAIEETLFHYRDFELTGGAIRIDGRIEAFTVGEALNSSTAVCHFEKAMPQFQGLGQVINQWFAKNNLGKFVYINREQDLGIPGLRRAKESYYPNHFVAKVRIILPANAEQ